jgi:undecaprenyl-diphosphatase
MRVAWLMTASGAALFVLSATLVRLEVTTWDGSVYTFLDQVPSALARGLTPISRVFLPTGLVIVVVFATSYAVVRARTPLPFFVAAASGGLAWMAAIAAKAVQARPRPYEVIGGAVLRQDPAHGTSFPSTHTAVAIAVAVALIPFLPRAFAVAGIVYASLIGLSRIYLGVHYPLDVIAGAGIGIAVGGLTLMALDRALRRTGAHAAQAARPDS